MAKGPAPDTGREKRRTGNRPLPSARAPIAVAPDDIVPASGSLNALPLTPPKHLSRSARETWLALVDDLRNVQGIQRGDAHALEQMAVLVSLNRRAQRRLERDGLMVAGKDGPKAHPLLSQYRSNALAIIRLSEQFGLTPAARLRLGVKALEGATLAEQLAKALNDVDG